jgi:hypothetical protein
VWTKVPLVPVIVNVTVPGGAVLWGATVRVVVPEPVTEMGLNRESVWAGAPLTLNVTFPVNPFSAVTVTVYEPWLPRLTVSVVGAAEIEKSAPAEEVTTRLTVVVCTVVPLVPVIVRVNVPVGVVLAVVTVMVEEPEAVTDVGLKLAEAPEGNPLALKVTVPLNPFKAAMVAV